MIDRENNYSGAAGHTITATGPSTDVIDHRLDRDLGIGEPMVVVIVLRAAPDAGNADETYAAQLQTDDNSAFSSATSIGPSVTILRTALSGAKYCICIPPDTLLERYTRLNFTLGGTTPSLTYEAWMTSWRAVQNDQYYADAVTIG